MVVLAASICTRSGKPVVSRQFREMSRSRIESLLTSFPKLIPPSSQHTSVETEEVRYVYQPLEDLYIVLITNKASNILQDIETIHLLARVVSDQCRSAEQKEISKKAFELLGAFDEIVSLGYREPMNMMQVRNVLEMESHEEKIQEIIARNKEAEAKEELKRRAKQLEMQRRDQQRRAQGGAGGSSSFGASSNIGGYSPVPRYEAPSPVPRNPSPAPSTLKPPAFKSSGMKLGAKKSTSTQLIAELGDEATPSTNAEPPRTPVTSGTVGRGSIPAVHQENVHVQTKEKLTASLSREGGLLALELSGDMNLLVSEPSNSKIRLTLADEPDTHPGVQFKQHPNVAKFLPDEPKVISMKDSARGFLVGQPLAVLKWRYKGNDERWIPLSVTCWPTPSGSGTCDVNLEYELEGDDVTLYDIVISVPLPSGSYPTVSSASEKWTVNPATHSLDWSIPEVSGGSRSGSLEFNVGGDDPEAFFPVKATFVGSGSLAKIQVTSASQVANGSDVRFSQDRTFYVGDFTIS